MKDLYESIESKSITKERAHELWDEFMSHVDGNDEITISKENRPKFEALLRTAPLVIERWHELEGLWVVKSDDGLNWWFKASLSLSCNETCVAMGSDRDEFNDFDALLFFPENYLDDPSVLIQNFIYS